MKHRYPPPQRDRSGVDGRPHPTRTRTPSPRHGPAPTTRATRLPVPPPSHRSGRQGQRTTGTPTALLDRPTTRVPVITLASPEDVRSGPADGITRTDLAGPTGMGTEQPPPSRRVAKVVLVVALVAAAAGLAIALPDDGSSERADGGSITRVETDGPTTRASLLTSNDGLAVDGELTDAGALAQQARSSLLQLPDPSGPIAIDTAELTNLVEPAAGMASPAEAASDDAATTTTTAWAEPALPLESEWVNSGNGVQVPDILLRIRFCESTNDYQAANSYSTARGAYQFLTGSWDWYGHAERTGVSQAHLASPAQQDQAALRTLQSEGTGPWSESRPCWSDPDIDPRYAAATPPTTARPTTTASTATTTGSGSSTTATTGDSTTTSSNPSTGSSSTAPASTTTTMATTATPAPTQPTSTPTTAP